MRVMDGPNKVLFFATVDYHFQAFHLPYLKWFKDQGWEVHVAAYGNMELPFVDKKYNVPVQRSPLSLQNIKAYQQLTSIIDQNKYRIIHCHTPMGGVLGRLAARKARKEGTKVIYTAHGFHFCKGAPLLNWLVYYPIEKSLAHFTDCLITINEEDYNLAKSHGFRAGQIEHVHGVGVNTERFKPVGMEEKQRLREKLGYKPDDFLMFYAAEFNNNKNQQLLIHALSFIKNDVPRAKLLLAGEGALMQYCQELAEELGVKKMVDFLGYRKDIDYLLPMCDIVVASSLREGLPVNIMEAMACGLPVVASDNRGHRELVQNKENGWIIDDAQDLADKIRNLSSDSSLMTKLGMSGRNMVEQSYSVRKVLHQKTHIYFMFMDEVEDLQWAVH
jgi:glycosyltransferase EpsD